MRLAWPRPAWALLGFATGVLWPIRGRAEETVQACLDAAEDGQKLRDSGSYLKARERFIVCAGSECPGEVRKRCVDWLGQLEKVMPTVVLGAQARGAEITDVRVTMDGKLIAERIDGKPIPVDPGGHRFRFERPGEEAVDRTTVVRAGEKERLVSVRFGPEPSLPGPPLIPAPREEPAEYAYALGAAGLLSLGAGAVLDISAYVFLQNCNGDASCTGSHERAEVEWRFVTGDILLGAGVLCGVLAWLHRPRDARAVSYGPRPFVGAGAPRGRPTLGFYLSF